MTKIYVLRHGETEWNRLTKLQGREDIELNDTGREQAKLVSEYFKDINVDVIYSSPLKRAYETAQIIAENNSINSVIEEFNLVERDYGLASGYTAAERKIKFTDGKYPGIEETKLVTERMISTLIRLGEENSSQNIVVVSHGSAINTVLSALSNNEIGSGKTRLHTCCVNQINFINNELSIEFYNKKVY